METIRFEDLELDAKIMRAITDMGFEAASPIQGQAIPLELQGLDIIGQAQTGTGKTAAFGIPLLQKIDPKNKKPQAIILCQQMGSPEQIYNEPENAFVADFIGESNIVDGLMIHDELVEIFGAKFACVDKGFGTNQPVDVVIRPEDIDLVKPEEGTLQGIVTHLIFKGVHYEMEVTTPDGYEWLVHSTDMFPVGEKVGIHVDPFDIQIMNKPASEDEEAVGVNE